MRNAKMASTEVSVAFVGPSVRPKRKAPDRPLAPPSAVYLAWPGNSWPTMAGARLEETRARLFFALALHRSVASFLTKRLADVRAALLFSRWCTRDRTENGLDASGKVSDGSFRYKVAPKIKSACD